MSDRYQLLRDSLVELKQEAAKEGATNPRAELIMDLLAERDALAAELDALKAQRGEAFAFANFKEMELCMHRPADGEWTPVYTAPPATDALVEELEREFPLFDDEGLDEVKHHCEWVLLQDRKRLHQLLATYRASQRKECTCR